MKSVKKETVGIPFLSESGQRIDAHKGKAECFDNYFTSVFSEPLGDATFPTSSTTLRLMAESDISPEGILHFLGSLEEEKAHGPDCIPTE